MNYSNIVDINLVIFLRLRLKKLKKIIPKKKEIL